MITIDYRDPRPIYEQIVEKITDLAIQSILPAHEKLPSVRQLAVELSINPNTIQRAYQTLEQAGVIYSQKGRGSFISDNFEGILHERKKELIAVVYQTVEKARSLQVEKEELVRYVEDAYDGKPLDSGGSGKGAAL